MSAPSHRAPGTGETSQQRNSYVPRRPEQALLYTTLAAHLKTFLAQREDRPLPRFVTRELRAFLECGILAHGFLRVRCPACREERLVPFSCKGRGFCPSCGGRRMADTAAWLVDRVLPEVPVRQWVLTLPFALRYRLAFDAELITVVLAEFMRAVFSSLHRRARHECGISKPRCGAVTFVQRFGEPDDDSSSADPLAEEESWLAALAAASVQGRIAIGPQAGQRLLKLGDRVDAEDLSARSSPLCANIAGLGLHAGVALPARDRQRLERLCLYVARTAIAASRLSALDDGRLLYQLKRRWRDGTTHVVFEPLEFIAKLAALVPAPRVHLVRYHGVLAPGAAGRARIVPQPEDAEETSAQ